MEASSPCSASVPTLRRTLSLWDLILYGIIVIQPTAPMSIFGVLSDRGQSYRHPLVTFVISSMAGMGNQHFPPCPCGTMPGPLTALPYS
jgi:hypothetical protein